MYIQLLKFKKFQKQMKSIMLIQRAKTSNNKSKGLKVRRIIMHHTPFNDNIPSKVDK